MFSVLGLVHASLEQHGLVVAAEDCMRCLAICFTVSLCNTSVIESSPADCGLDDRQCSTRGRAVSVKRDGGRSFQFNISVYTKCIVPPCFALEMEGCLVVEDTDLI